MREFLAGAVVDVRSDIREAFSREWDRLAAPGAFWTGAERVAIAGTARTARGLESGVPELPVPAATAARLLAVQPAAARRGQVDAWVGELGAERYVELVGVVSRLAAVDSFHRGVNAGLPALPEPVRGSPSGEADPAARTGPAWVPMVGGASVVFALSLVPPESAAQEEMHGSLYLTYQGMEDLEFVRGLTRTQMELVAARTSAINECFY